MEIGPVLFDYNGNLVWNPHSWITKYNVLFVDQPITVGLSYGQMDDIPTNQNMIAQQFYYALMELLYSKQGCFKQFSQDEIQNSKWFIIGESYAGKYIPSIAKYIIEMNQQSNLLIPLTGIGIGDPFIDPLAVVTELGSFSYNLGLIDSQERSKVDSLALNLKKLLQKQAFRRAKTNFFEIISYIKKQSGITHVYNILKSFDYNIQEQYITEYFNKLDIKALFGFVDDWRFEISFQGPAAKALDEDYMQSNCIQSLQFVIKHIPVLIFQGQNDLIVPSSATQKWINTLKFDGSSEFRIKELQPWIVNQQVIGYNKKSDRVNYYLINNGGHHLPMDQPSYALNMVDEMRSSMILLLLVIVSSRLLEPTMQDNPNIASGPHLSKGTTCKKVDAKDLNENFSDNQVIFSGYLNVQDGIDAGLAFIFYGSQKADLTTLFNYPTIIWLNGGPGSSSQIGNFMEIGPVMYDQSGKLFFNKEYTWTKEYNVMFVDQPITVGYSYGQKADIPKDQDALGEHFYYALLQFIQSDTGCVKAQQLKGFETSKWFIFGESYAGKYIPAIARTILIKNKTAALKIPLKGIGIGDPFTDPQAVIAEYGSYGFNLGLIDSQERQYADTEALSSIKALKKGDYLTSRAHFWNAEKYIVAQSGGMNVYNIFVYGTYQVPDDAIEAYLDDAATKTKFGFDTQWVYKLSGGPVSEVFQPDFMKRDCVAKVEDILKEIPVVVYQGQNDLIVPASATLRWVYELNYAGTKEFQNKDMEVWKLNNEVVGYRKIVGNLEYYTINNAGHLVPTDQPAVALALIKTFISAHSA